VTTAPIRFDPGGLEAALAALNAARGLPADDPRRVADSLRGLEELIAAAWPSLHPRSTPGDRALAELDELLVGAGHADGAALVREYLAPIADRLVETILGRPEERLAAYGSLRPGRENHHLLASLVGEWRDGTVRGRLDERGWGATMGYPGLVCDRGGEEVAVRVFFSAALPAQWGRLDAFEGPSYRRILVPVESGDAVEVCNLYEARADRAG